MCFLKLASRMSFLAWPPGTWSAGVASSFWTLAISLDRCWSFSLRSSCRTIRASWKHWYGNCSNGTFCEVWMAARRRREPIGGVPLRTRRISFHFPTAVSRSSLLWGLGASLVVSAAVELGGGTSDTGGVLVVVEEDSDWGLSCSRRTAPWLKGRAKGRKTRSGRKDRATMGLATR